MECLCSCGQSTPIDKKGRPNKYVRGHKGFSMVAAYDFPINKKCNRCRKILSIDNFGLRNLDTNGFNYKRPRSKCKKCESALTCQYQSKPEIRKLRTEKRRNDRSVKSWIQERIAGWRKKTPNSNLTTAYLLNIYESAQGKCYYTNEPMEVLKQVDWDERYQHSISLDRLNPNKGYMQGNVVFCKYGVNIMKGVLTEQSFYEKMKQILANRAD